MNDIIEWFEWYIEMSKTMASSNEDTPFMKFFFPFIFVAGCSVFFYYGYKGIVKKKTISLFKARGLSARESHELVGGAGITGIMAVFSGILYILMGILLLIVLGGSSYYSVFG